MTKPEMIMFDLGHTLHYQHDASSEAGVRAQFQFVTKNPHGYTADDAVASFKDAESIADKQLEYGYEVGMEQLFNLAYGRLGLEFSISGADFETVFWNASTKGGDVMPGAAELIDYMNEAGIRMAIISNNDWIAETLKRRMDRLFPRNNFEFVLSSCEYPTAKPDKRFFEVGLVKAGLTADKVWYVGDSMKMDVYGSHGAGMFPVLYEELMPFDTPDRFEANRSKHPDFEYLYVKSFAELIDTLKSL